MLIVHLVLGTKQPEMKLCSSSVPTAPCFTGTWSMGVCSEPPKKRTDCWDPSDEGTLMKNSVRSDR